MFFENLLSYQNKAVNKNEQNVISYSQIKKIENIFYEKVSSNYNLLISHIIIKHLVHINRRWVYIRRHCNYNKL